MIVRAMRRQGSEGHPDSEEHPDKEDGRGSGTVRHGPRAGAGVER
jgi:hypothetical protein